jgi:diacylglycerol O-acyltransferase
VSANSSLQRIAGRDAVWLQESPQNLMVINSVFTFDPMDVETLRQIFAERILAEKERFPRFTHRVVFQRGRPYWSPDDDFDLERHIFLAPPLVDDPEALTGPEKLQAYVAGLASVPLSQDRPLWELHFIPHLSDDRSAFLGRVHHVMADGMSVLPVIFSLMDRSEDDDTAEIDREARAMNKPRSSAATLVKAALAGPLLLLQKLLWKADKNLLHGPALSGKKRVAWTRPIDVELLKKIKDAAGVTLNDVLMSSVAGAFDRYAIQRSGAPLDQLRMSMPINIRAHEEEPKMENKFAAVLFELPVGITDPRQRLQVMSQRLARLKGSIEPIFTYGTVRLMLAVLPLWMSRALIDYLGNKCTCVISNVPGPRRQVQLAGRHLRAMLFWVPQRADVGIGVSMMSFAGKLYLGVLADTALVDDPAELVDAFTLELEELREAVAVAP